MAGAAENGSKAAEGGGGVHVTRAMLIAGGVAIAVISAGLTAFNYSNQMGRDQGQLRSEVAALKAQMAEMERRIWEMREERCKP